ncbi:MAG: biopolymer transporter ExbD [Verrucomicrobiota bacterium]|nr:biopolymer transporter ExbD [Verrucomicrobiota bacterium]MEC8753405.1 biopolymer transporter ExbD [Verrucomicrobiota bacterium]
MHFKSQFDDDEDINMAPMIDMVFLLLIFFMVASHMIKIDKTPVELPQASSSVVPEKISDRTFITIRSSDTVGEEVEFFMNLKNTTIEDIKTKISDSFLDNENISICLRADKFVRHKHIKNIMQICAEIGVSDVIFAAFEVSNK